MGHDYSEMLDIRVYFYSQYVTVLSTMHYK